MTTNPNSEQALEWVYFEAEIEVEIRGCPLFTEMQADDLAGHICSSTSDKVQMCEDIYALPFCTCQVMIGLPIELCFRIQKERLKELDKDKLVDLIKQMVKDAPDTILSYLYHAPEVLRHVESEVKVLRLSQNDQPDELYAHYLECINSQKMSETTPAVPPSETEITTATGK